MAVSQPIFPPCHIHFVGHWLLYAPVHLAGFSKIQELGKLTHCFTIPIVQYLVDNNRNNHYGDGPCKIQELGKLTHFFTIPIVQYLVDNNRNIIMMVMGLAQPLNNYCWLCVFSSAPPPPPPP